MSEAAAPATAPVKAVTSAYMFFQGDQYTNHKESFAGLALGQQGAEISRRWRSLSPEERSKFDALAAKDRERHQAESEARDAEVAARQEANRAARLADPASNGYMRERAAVEPKKQRKVTREEDMSEEQLEARRRLKEKREQQKAARLAAEAESERQKDSIAAAAAATARKRIKYILRQSDIFATHFGVVLSDSEDEEDKPQEEDKSKGAAAAGGSPSKRRQAGGGAAADEMLDDVNGESSAPTFLTTQPPSISGGTLRSYQLEGLNWMVNLQAQGTNGILADEMGLGKTLQSISILAYMRDFQNVTGPHIILLPKSVLGNWQLEFKRFCPSVRVLRLSGTKDERAATIRDGLKPGVPEEERDWDVLLTTYEVANIEKTALTKIGWRYLIIDEAHRLKNESSLFSMTVRELTTQYRLLLTGTPLQNNLHELWALLNFLLPSVFKDSEAFSKVFDLNVDDADKKQNMIKQLHKILRPFMLRRLKKEVEKSLPPKEETILFTGMSEVQRKVYKGVLMRDIDTVNGANAGRTAILNIVMQLRKCCNHPYLFPNTEDRNLDPMGEHLVENCGKMVLLDKLLTRLKAAGHRVLVFSQMTRMMDILEDLMHMRGHQYCRIDGNTPHDTRQDLIEEYNTPGSEKFVFLLSTRAGGLGINLQSADTCILYDSDWNPQADLQAQDRCHRIGQTKTVKVYRLVTEDTIEEKVVERAQQKLKLDAMVVQRGMLQGEKKLEKDEMLAAIRFGADAVFRCKDTVMSDQDLDAVLERGAKKTKEMQSKLNVADKGDMLDFSFDDGTGVQNFEGINYGDKKLRDQMRAGFIDIGRRERKPAAVKAYAPPLPRMEPKKITLKMPKELEMPKMKDHQMFDRARIVELQDELQDNFKALKDRGTKIPLDYTDIASMLLSPEKVKEREELIAQGFPGWNRTHYYSFLDGMAIYGRDRLELVAPMVGKPVEEVLRYGEAFWRQGPKTFSEEAWKRIKTRVEVKEKRLNELNRIMMVTNELVEGVDDPWSNMEVRVNQRQAGGGAAGMQLQREWTKDEDRYLLCLTHLCGWGNWHKVRACILASPRFTFDYYLRSLSETALGKHCEQLMKSSDKYLQDLHDRMKKEAKKEMDERGMKERDEAAAAREDDDYELRLQNTDTMLEAAEREIEDADNNKRYLEVIVEGIRTGTVSLDNPSVRALLETCASNGIGTAGLDTNTNYSYNPNAIPHANHFVNHPAPEMAGFGTGGGAGGGRKSPSVGGKKSPSPASSVGVGGKKKTSVARVPASGNTGNSNGSAKGPAAAGSSAGAFGAPTANGEAKKSGGGTKGAAKAEAASKAEGKSPKSPKINVVDRSSPKSSSTTPKSSSSTPKSSSSSSTPKSGDKAGRASGGSKGKVGLAVPKTLFPELARVIEKGDLTSKDDMTAKFQQLHPAFTLVAVAKAIGEVGEKASRGSKWKVLDKAKKYLSMPVHQGNVPEEVAVLSAQSAKRKSGEPDSNSAKKRKSSTGNGISSKSDSSKNGSSTNGKAKITNFLRPIDDATAEAAKATKAAKGKATKAAASGKANGAVKSASGGGSGSTTTPSKKRKASGGGGGGGGNPKSPKSPKSPKCPKSPADAFKSFCRANRTKVQAEHPGGTKTEIADKLLKLWGELDPKHAVVDANHWATGRASSSRSSTLAVMQPGGRNRPIRDWKAIKRESEEKLNKQAEEKALEKARQAGEVVEDVGDAVGEAVKDRTDRLETASAEVLELEEGTPQSLGVMVAKVAVIATVGLYGAKKVIAFTKAVLKGRKEAPTDVDDESPAVEAINDDDEDEDQVEGGDGDGDETVALEQDADDGQEEEKDEDEDAAAEEESDEVTDGDGFVTAEDDEGEGEGKDEAQRAAAALGSDVEAAKDMAAGMKKSTMSKLDSLKAKAKTELQEATDRADGDGDGDGDGEEAEEGALRASLPKGGKVDVSYV
eukprot:g1728.t2